MTNAPALFRSLLVYGICLPLAVILGYLLATPMDLPHLGVVLIVFSVLAVPVLLRWHHIWLIAAWNSTAMLFFIPGKPQVWMGLAAISLAISILQYTLNRNMRFLSAPSVAWPLLLLTAVILITARLTGGLFSLRMFGGDTYGAKRYFIILAAVMGYFAIISRPIPPKRAGLYVALFFLGAATVAIANLPGVINPAFNFLFVFFPVANVDSFSDQNTMIGPTGFMPRYFGLAGLGPCGLLPDVGPLRCPRDPGRDEALAVGPVLPFCRGQHAGRVPVNDHSTGIDLCAAFLFGRVASYQVAACPWSLFCWWAGPW